jgi:hypothetical protein
MNQKSINQWFSPAVGLLGGLLISVGILFFVGDMLDIRLGANFWPLFIIVPGVALFFVTLFIDEEIGAALSIVSSMTTMSGLILFAHAITGYWSTWPYTWTLLFPTSIGLGMLAYGVGKNKTDLSHAGWDLTKVGLALFLVFAAFFEFILGLGGFGLRFGWPLLFVSLGLLLFTLREFDYKHVALLLSQGAGDRLGIDKYKEDSYRQ